MTYLYNEEKINAHKEWGWLRQIRYTEDFLFSTPGNGHHAGAALPAQPPEPDGI